MQLRHQAGESLLANDRLHDAAGSSAEPTNATSPLLDKATGICANDAAESGA
jgi:hypothetical protein